MAAIKLEAFQGLIPRASPRLLPPMAATIANNTKLLNGEVRGFRALREEADFSAGSVTPVRRAMRVVDNAGVNPDKWLTFDSRGVDVVRSPIINDTYDRYYWAGDGAPMMNTYARIYAGSTAYLLGVPTPANAAAVTPPSGTDETRAYVYTFVSEFGEEGPPSPPVVATGDAGTWALSGMGTTVPDAASRAFGSGAKTRIYRTVSSATSSNFYYVGEVAFGTATFNDDVAASTVAANNLLESTGWVKPSDDLEGFVVMPNGYLVGWVGRRLVFSEPYRPHAWPAAYELSTEFPIVGLVVWGSTLVIGTKSQPYFGQGTTPQSFTMQKLDAVEPCLSRRGMVATTAGAYYPSINGLILANSSGAKVITQDILTKEEWAVYLPGSIYAAQLGLQYIAFTSQTVGFIFNPTEPQTKLVELEGFSDVDGIETDRYSGNVLLLANDRAVEWDPTSSERLNWQWQSKLIQTPEPVNFGCYRLNFKTGSEDVSADIVAYYGAYNAALFVAVPSGDTPTVGDPYWDDVVLLAKFNGADAATAYTEESTLAVNATFHANAQLDTGVSPFEGSASLQLDGTGDAVSFKPTVANEDEVWQLAATDDCTLDVVFRLDALPGVGEIMTLAAHGDQDNVSIQFEIENDGGTYLLRGRTGFGNFPEAEMSGLAINTWYHAALQRRYDASNTYIDLFWDCDRIGSVVSNNIPTDPTMADFTIGAWDNTDSDNFTREFQGRIDVVRFTHRARYGDVAAYTPPTASEYYAVANDPAINQRGLNTINGAALGGSPAQARDLVASWTDPETRQPLGGSLLYPEATLSFQTLAVRIQVKVGPLGEVKYDKVIYDEGIYRLPTGFKSDLWQFNFYGNTDLYSAQIATTPRSLKEV